MSYFDVHVILPKEGENMRNVDQLLAPYYENLAVEPYIIEYKSEAKKLLDEKIASCKKMLDSQGAKSSKDPKYNFDESIDYYLELCKMSPEQYWDSISDGEETDKDGNIICYHNPNAKWDSYEECEHLTVEEAMANEELPHALVLPNGTWLDCEENEDDDKWREIVKEHYKKYPGHAITTVECHI